MTSTDKATTIIAEVTQSNAAVGADWANSLVVVEFTEGNTAVSDTFIGDALLEIQVDDSGKRTWFVPIEITKGTIA